MWEKTDESRHFIGTFNVGESEISGELIYNKAKGFMLLNLTRQVDGFGKSYGKIKYIKGKLNSGSFVTLYNNHCTKNHTQSFAYQNLHFIPKYIVFSNDDSAKHKFNKLVCIIENGVWWSGLSKIEDKSFDEIKFKHIDNPVFKWFGTTITFSTHMENELWSFPKKEVSRVIERLSIEIESEEKKDIDFFINIRNNIISLITFAIKDNVNIDEQYLYDNDYFYNISNDFEHKQYYKFDLLTNEPLRPLFHTNMFEYNFTLKQLQSNDEMSEILSKLIPIFNLYESIYRYSDIPYEVLFLNVIQALETLHARFFYENKKANYVKSVEDRFSSCSNYDMYKKLLLSDTQMDENCNYIILVSRLNDMLIGKNDGLFYEFYGEDTGYAQRIADTRHYYTHYNKSKEEKALKGADLNDAIYIMKLLLEYHVCSILKIDTTQSIANRLKSYFNSK